MRARWLGPLTAVAALTAGCGTPAVRLRELPAGSCFNTRGIDSADDRIETVPCEREHVFESFAVTELRHPPAAPFPGVEPLRDELTKLCEPLFPGFVGSELEPSEYGIYPVVPLTEESWRSGYRRVVCALFPRDQEPWTGTARGSGGEVPGEHHDEHDG